MRPGAAWPPCRSVALVSLRGRSRVFHSVPETPFTSVVLVGGAAGDFSPLPFTCESLHFSVAFEKQFCQIDIFPSAPRMGRPTASGPPAPDGAAVAQSEPASCAARGVSPCRVQDAVPVFRHFDSSARCGSVCVHPPGVRGAFWTRRWLLLRLGPRGPPSPRGSVPGRCRGHRRGWGGPGPRDPARSLLSSLPQEGPAGLSSAPAFLLRQLTSGDQVLSLQLQNSVRLGSLHSFRLFTDVSCVAEHHSDTLILQSVSRGLARGPYITCFFTHLISVVENWTF